MFVVQIVIKSVHVREIILSKPWFQEGKIPCVHRLNNNCKRKCLVNYSYFWTIQIVLGIQILLD